MYRQCGRDRCKAREGWDLAFCLVFVVIRKLKNSWIFSIHVHGRALHAFRPLRPSRQVEFGDFWVYLQLEFLGFWAAEPPLVVATSRDAIIASNLRMMEEEDHRSLRLCLLRPQNLSAEDKPRDPLCFSSHVALFSPWNLKSRFLLEEKNLRFWRVTICSSLASKRSKISSSIQPFIFP